MDGAHDDMLSPDEIIPAVVVADELLVIDVNGADGEHGRDGQGHSGSRASRGQDGRDAEDALPPEPGQAAGDIELMLRGASGAQRVELSGRRFLPGGREQQIRESVNIGETGVVRLSARGGNGGDGGRGGDGEAGGKGHDGADATQWSAGGDGSPGGDGGNGGDGTSGAEGGHGGHIVVQVDEQDTHLLMLVKHEVNGGQGGQPGANGRGGEGGPGGDGGRSYAWTTTSTEYTTDAQGHRQPRVVTHHHRNQGGFDGSSGRPGRDGQSSLRGGAEGNPGDFRILVRHGQQTAEYRQRYEVEVVRYDVQLTDEFAEPSSEVRLANITVRNTGGMPTPQRYPPVLVLPASHWAEPRGDELPLPRSLEPGETYTFHQDALRATVPDIDAVPVGEPLRQRDRIAPLSRQSGANRWFDNLHPRQEFEIAFPAELAAVQSLESQTPGRAAIFTIGMTNRSQNDLGRDSASRRFLAVHVELTNRELAEHVMLLDMQAQPISWESGYQEEVARLGAGETWSRQLILGVLPGAPGYRQAELAVTLQLGQLAEPHQPKDRHCLVYPVRVALAYRYDAAADLLLIANHATTMEELKAWKEAAARLGKTISLWDISLNDSLSLSQQLAHGQSLLRDFHGKTMILSNAPFFTALGTRHGDQFVSQMDLIKAAESHGIRVLVVNDDQHDLAHLFQERLIPTDGEPEYRYDSVNAFRKSQPADDVDVLFDQVDELIKHGAQAARPDPIRQTSEIDLYGIRAPSARRLQQQAVKLQRRLQNDTPGRRVVVMYRLPNEETEEEQRQRRERDKEHPRGGLFFTHDYQGTLTVMPTLGDNHPNLVVLPAPSEQIHDPGFIAGAEITASLLQALSFENKVYLLSARIRDLGEAWRIDPQGVQDTDISMTQFLVDAILVDLATEQAAVLKTGWQGLFSGHVIRDALSQLKFLAEHPFPLVTGGAEQPDVQLAARLIAGVTFLGQTSSRWYESRWFPWGLWRRGPVLRSAILGQQEVLKNHLFRRPNADQQRLMEDLLRQYYAATQGRPTTSQNGQTTSRTRRAVRTAVAISHSDRCRPRLSRCAVLPAVAGDPPG